MTCFPTMFELRDRFVHGLWIPEKFNVKLGHEMPGQKEGALMPTPLREAAHYILRKSLLKAIQP